MECLQLNNIGVDAWKRPVYADQYKRLWKDITHGRYGQPELCSVQPNEYEGEPDQPINQTYTIVTPYIKNENVFEYQMLDQLRQRLNTHFDYESKYARRLSITEQQEAILNMKRYWKTVNEKPEWLTWNQILEYETQLKLQ